MKAIVWDIFQGSPSGFELGRNVLQLTSILCSSVIIEKDF